MAAGSRLCMTAHDGLSPRFVLLIRDEPRSVRAALRVPATIRDLQRISFYAVSTDGSTRELR